MESKLVLVLLIFNLVLYVKCPYPPTGEEVVPGSVLLPASRRGRYLANIVRRQATDGTGIKFNKDADRMNAEAKKKVDVLSDELLPYIIAEQERRTTLYKRIMTAIQNGEKGVTIAEIRNKPPLIIRKGVMYRCPANRAPKEPDGSGVLLCEEAIEPTQIMYDSCLSAEDKDLYVAENKYFFCNRHRIEGPDLPRNGSTVIGCAPTERTSLNYTTGKCALEDTDDIVVHYRYYPDRTYKFVMELDPDHEVCDHWNPCQIGYIYSLPGPDQALPATDLWRNTPEKVGDYERDELVPPIPEDSNDEFVSSGAPNYSSSPRKVPYPGKKATRRTGASTWKFEKVWAKRNTDGYGWNPAQSRWRTRVVAVESEHYVTITLHFPENFDEFFFSSYYVIFSNSNGQHAKSEKFLTITQSKATVKPEVLHMTYGETGNNSDIPYHCLRCHIQSIMIRTPEGHVHNLDSTRTRIKEALDQTGRPKQFLEIRVGQLKPQEFGDFYAIIQNADGMEERIKVLIVRAPEKDTENSIKLTREKASLEPSAHLDRSIKFECDDCELTDVKWNGQSAIAAGKIAFVPVSKMITINLPSFDDSSSGVYLALFKKGGETFQKIVLVIDNSVSGVTVGAPEVVAPPSLGEQFEKEITYSCDDCTLEQVVVNGIALESTPNTRRNNGNSVGSIAYYLYTPTTITIRIIEYTPTFEGVYQAIFNIGGENVTKTIFEIGEGSSDSAAADTATEVATEAAPDAGGETTHAEEETTVEGGAGEETTVPAEGHEEEATVPAEGDAETEATEGGEATEGEDAAEAETEAAAEGRRQLGSTTDKGTTIVGITVKGTTVEGTTVKGTKDKGTTEKGTTDKGTTDKSTIVEKTTERPTTATA